MDEHPLLERLGRLLARVALASAEDQLRLELPVAGDLPLLLDAGVRDRVVVLQVGAEALLLQGNPQRQLVHGRGVLAPLRELVGEKSVRLLQLVDGGGVFEEEDLRGGVSQWRCHRMVEPQHTVP